MVAVVGREEDVRVVQLTADLQPVHYFLHQVVHREQSLPPAGDEQQQETCRETLRQQLLIARKMLKTEQAEGKKTLR